MTKTNFIHDQSRRHFIKSASAIVGLSGTGLIGRYSFAADATPIVAKTRYGSVRGVHLAGSNVFKGIPYARTAKRLEPPSPPDAWSGVRDALEFGPRALQVAPSTDGMSESCQMLNIWTPQVGSGKRPVMVWLHGGGFMNGSANTDLYDGSDLNREGDVVVVTLNHRLGAFGYLDVNAAGRDYDASGCAGMLDIVAALRWIHDNIAEFGGDPNNVTIFGESGGGGKVLTVMTMPSAKGLFHRAIVQSGALQRTAATREEGLKTTADMLAAMNLSSTQLRQLLDAPAGALLKAQATLLARAGTPGSGGNPSLRPFSPVIGRELPEQPFDPNAPTVSADVPLMLGFNKEETRFFFTGTPQLYALEANQLRERLQPLLGDNTDIVLDVYRKTRPNASATDLFFAITTAQMYGYTTSRVAERKARQGRAPAYMYRFDYEGTRTAGNPPVAIKAGHSMEIPFVFAHPRPDANNTVPPHERALAKQMSQSWINFARTGNPNHDGLPTWPTYLSDRRAVMLFDQNCTVTNDLDAEERRLWAKLLGQP